MNSPRATRARTPFATRANGEFERLAFKRLDQIWEASASKSPTDFAAVDITDVGLKAQRLECAAQLAVVMKQPAAR
jgi:hypothetical protein